MTQHAEQDEQMQRELAELRQDKQELQQQLQELRTQLDAQDSRLDREVKDRRQVEKHFCILQTSMETVPLGVPVSIACPK